MASVASYSSLFSLLLIVSLVHIAQGDLTTQEWIDKICQQSTDYQVCTQIFKDNIKSPSASLVDLTQLTIQAMLPNVTYTWSYAKKLLANASNPEAVKIMTECSKGYELIEKALQAANTYFQRKDYKQMVAQESSTQQALDKCDGQIHFLPFPDYPFFLERNKLSRIQITMCVAAGRYLTA